MPGLDVLCTICPSSGKPHVIEIECDLWPEITYAGEKGYKGLKVTVTANPVDTEKLEKVKNNIRERYKELSTTPEGERGILSSYR
jgi:FKBP-type peptidyl-prolyl cis-trans isomerase (trigger factor)